MFEAETGLFRVGEYLRNYLLVLNIDHIDVASRLLLLSTVVLVDCCTVIHSCEVFNLVGEKVPLRLGNTHDIISGSWLLEGWIVCIGRRHCLTVDIHAGAQLLPVEVSQKVSFTRPDLDPALLQRQELLLLIEEDECFRWGEVGRLSCRAVLAIYYFKRIAACLEHDSLVELLEELDLSPGLVEADLHQDLASVHVDKGHGDAVCLNNVEEEHDAVAYLKLGNLGIVQHIL